MCCSCNHIMRGVAGGRLETRPPPASRMTAWATQHMMSVAKQAHRCKLGQERTSCAGRCRNAHHVFKDAHDVCRNKQALKRPTGLRGSGPADLIRPMPPRPQQRASAARFCSMRSRGPAGDGTTSLHEDLEPSYDKAVMPAVRAACAVASRSMIAVRVHHPRAARALTPGSVSEHLRPL